MFKIDRQLGGCLRHGTPLGPGIHPSMDQQPREPERRGEPLVSLLFPKRLCLFGFLNSPARAGRGLTEGETVRDRPKCPLGVVQNRQAAGGLPPARDPPRARDPPQNGPIAWGARSSWSPTYCSILAAPRRPNPHESVAHERPPPLSWGLGTPPGHSQGTQMHSQRMQITAQSSRMHSQSTQMHANHRPEQLNALNLCLLGLDA